MNEAISTSFWLRACVLLCTLVIEFTLACPGRLYADADPIVLTATGPDAPNVVILRDDRVATLELDFVAGNPWTPFDLGMDREGPVGYRITWRLSPEPAEPSLPIHFFNKAISQKLTSLRRTQIQPLLNDKRYFLKVEYVNRFGKIVGDAAQGVFDGGSSERIDSLRKEMTGFFDDFNVPAGLPDETKWNTSFSRCNDPAMQAFFVNSQFHTHTLCGTPHASVMFGDRGQTTHRVRNPLRIEPNETRRIVFDIDGLHIANRAFWYLDIVDQEVDITGQINVGGGEGRFGHPGIGLRFTLVGQTAQLFFFNAAGEQLLVEENRDLHFDGVQTLPNVRRACEIQLSQNHATMLMDGVEVLSSTLPIKLSPGDHTVLWSVFGYNTLKAPSPFALVHWDNFGFDGPAPDSVTHNYRTQIEGTDFVLSDDFVPETVEVIIPDDLTPLNGATGDARLVFTRQMHFWNPAEWTPFDSVTVNGVKYFIPEPVSATSPPLPLEDTVNSITPYSTSISLGTVGNDGTAPLEIGANELTFRAARSGFLNVHIEVEYSRGNAPEYTAPQFIHSFPLHHDFPSVGLPAAINRIDGLLVDRGMWNQNLIENFNQTVNGVIEIDTLVNASEFNSSTTLDSDFTSATLATAGENPGITHVQLWIRPDNSSEELAILLGDIDTSINAPTPQFIHTFELDTTALPNGTYELTFVAEDARGIMSVPAFGGIGETSISHSSELNGLYFPLHITIEN